MPTVGRNEKNMHGNRKVTDRLTDAINFRLTAMQRSTLENIADKERISMAEAARRALEAGLERELRNVI
jgi:hypothetical protein